MGINNERPFTRASAERGKKRVDRMLRDGELIQPFRGVYVSAATELDLPTRAACVALLLPEGAAVSRRTAAWLWGVDVRGPGSSRRPMPVECTVRVGREPVRRPGVRSFVAPLEPAAVTDLGGVACTTPLRTAVDLLRWLPPHMGLGAADAFAHRELIDLPELESEIGRWPGRPGIAQARRLAGLVEPETESFGESWLRLRIVDAGFPRPTPQIKLRDATGHVVHRLDLGWEARRIAIEYDGREHHESRAAQRADAARREAIWRGWRWDLTPVGMSEVLGRSLALERGIGELLGLTPQIAARAW